MNSPSICFLGDLTFDIVTHLSQLKMESLNFSRYERNEIEFAVGGTALNPAVSASHLGFKKVFIISKIGQNKSGEIDIPGQNILNCLIKNDIVPVLSYSKSSGTGKTLLVYFEDDQRLLIADRGANNTFSVEDIDNEQLETIKKSDIFFVSGYWLMNPSQAEASVELMREASYAGKTVVLDVVPHQIYKILDTSTFLKYTECVTSIISETNTVARIFPELNSYIDSDSESSEIPKIIFNKYHYKNLILIPNNDLFLICDRSSIKRKVTGYSGIKPHQKRGYLDKVLIKILLESYQI